MEIRIFKSLQHYNGNKPLYVARVDSPDVFDFVSALSVFHSIYGTGIVVIFMCV